MRTMNWSETVARSGPKVQSYVCICTSLRQGTALPDSLYNVQVTPVENALLFHLVW